MTQIEAFKQIYQDNRNNKVQDIFEHPIKAIEKRRFRGKELKVLVKIMQDEYRLGKTHKQIAEMLDISQEDVQYHLAKHLRKPGSRKRIE